MFGLNMEKLSSITIEETCKERGNFQLLIQAKPECQSRVPSLHYSTGALCWGCCTFLYSDIFRVSESCRTWLFNQLYLCRIFWIGVFFACLYFLLMISSGSNLQRLVSWTMVNKHWKCCSETQERNRRPTDTFKVVQVQGPRLDRVTEEPPCSTSQRKGAEASPQSCLWKQRWFWGILIAGSPWNLLGCCSFLKSDQSAPVLSQWGHLTRNWAEWDSHQEITAYLKI